jgi:thiol-disulfide isomerase/thioredoxin
MQMPKSSRRFGPRVQAGLLFLALAAGAVSAGTPGEVPIGGVLRAAQLRGLNGASQNLSDFRGRPLLINVWASWCGPCKSEMASLERLAWLDRGQYFAIIGISTDDDADQARRLLRESNATISHYIDSHLQMENMLGAVKLPLTVLVDSDGRVLKKIYGARQWDSADALRLIDEAFRAGPARQGRGASRSAAF